MEKNNWEAYQKEWDDSIAKMEMLGKQYHELNYFLELARKYGVRVDSDKKKSRVYLLGMNYPEEIIMALGINPVYVLGGSFISTIWADQMVPRDTDACIRSTLGLLTKEEFGLKKSDIILVPITCDSMRKLAYMLKNKFEEEGIHIIPFTLPCDVNDPLQKRQWEQEVKSVYVQLRCYLKSGWKLTSFKRAAEQKNKVKKAIARLEEKNKKAGCRLNGLLRMFLYNSYLWEKDKEVWCKHIKALGTEIASKGKRSKVVDRKPQILLFGSPVYFPNYKIPCLLDEMGMDIAATVNPITADLTTKEDNELKGSNQDVLHHLCQKHLKNDISQAYVENENLYRMVTSLQEKEKFDGVVFLVFKGQIEYDFELRKYEAYFEEAKIPVFRLETDYSYQDVEQLRIRLEAFSEMITHKILIKERGA